MMIGREKPLSNDTATLTPKIVADAPVLEFDFPALQIGVAEYAEGPTGCTIFYFPDWVTGAVDVRGGAPGVPQHPWDRYDAICFAGGSLYGLEAATGVAAELLAQREYAVSFTTIASVGAAIIYDFARKNAVYPDKTLGRAALRAAQSGKFPLGACGAGASATVGKGVRFAYRESAGQGGAFRQLGPTKVAVFTVVNAVGAIVSREGQVVRGNLNPRTGERLDHLAEVERRLSANEEPPAPQGNTTITLLVTNQQFDTRSLRQLGRQVHSAMTRAIQPFHTVSDGDTLFAVTTNEVDSPALDAMTLGLMGSELAWDAVLSSFTERAPRTS
ncbi:MAG: 6-aminohexanoate hydrolase [Dehalococcoidia bacterium]|nr:6-aminohexanoate hydrolase [Dehalococcoidia bacterium]